MIKSISINAAIILFALSAPLVGSAQNTKTSTPANLPEIVQHIDSASRHKVEASDDIIDLLNPSSPEEKGSTNTSKGPQHTTVYRVQVYFCNSNEGAKAKTEAYRVKANVSRRFSGYATDVVFVQPNWKVLSGIFKTKAEAEEYGRKIRAAFPAYASQVHVTRSRSKVVK